MGAWGSKPFENDTALDWLNTLEDSADGAKLIVETIASALAEAVPESTVSEEATAAIAIVAAASHEPPAKVRSEAKAWILHLGYTPDAQLLCDAKLALSRIRESSELRELWGEEAGSLKSWCKALDAILAQLESADPENLPLRKPKKKGMPRTLPKMLERFDKEPSDKLREKIRAKFAAIENVNDTSKATDYELPLYLAAQYGLCEEASELLDRGADPNAQSFLGKSIVIAAVLSGDLAVLRLLFARGLERFTVISVDKRSGHSVEFAEILQLKDIDPEEKRFLKGLSMAAVHGTPEMLDFLISEGGDPAQLDFNGECLLHGAAESGNVPVMQRLLELGNPVDQPKKGGETPLFSALRSLKIEAVQLLLDAGANVNAMDSFHGEVDHWDITPLDVADRLPSEEIRALLLAHGARRAEDILAD